MRTLTRHFVLMGGLWLLPFLVNSTAGDYVHFKGVAAAAAEKKKETRKVPAMREKTYKVLSQALLLIDPEAAQHEDGKAVEPVKANPKEAINVLLKLLESRGMNSYETAQVWNALAMAYYMTENVPNTIKAYENVLKETIPEALELGAVRNLFQLYYQQENYPKALEYVDRLLALKELPDPDITFYKAMIYYQMKDFKRALVEARNVERIAIEQARTVKENWWYLQVVLLNEAKDYKAVIPVLEKLLVHYPSKQYWLQLAGMFVETTQDDKALSAYYAAYSQGMLTREGELVMLAQRLLNAEVPFEAAKVLERGLKAGTVTETDKNMTLLATCYTLSQDMDKAIDAWRNASKLGKDGDKFNRLAQALSQQDRHKEAIDAYRQALDHGVKDPEEIKFWLGISLMQTDQWDAAIEAFRDAAKDKGKEKTARQYIQYITGEQKRQEALKEMMKASAPRESKAG